MGGGAGVRVRGSVGIRGAVFLGGWELSKEVQ